MKQLQAILIIIGLAFTAFVSSKAFAEDVPFKCTTQSEVDFRRALPTTKTFSSASGDIVTQELGKLNRQRMAQGMEPWNGNKIVIAYSSDQNVTVALFDNGCLVSGSDMQTNLTTVAEIMVSLGISFQDLQHDTGV